MTGIELVREFFPNASDGEVEGLLWQCTCFPSMGGDDEAIAYYRKQLQEMKEKSGGVPARAMEIADEEITQACLEIRANERKMAQIAGQR